LLWRMLRESGFEGRIYPVNPRAADIDGVKAYPSVTAIPEPLDLVAILVPAAAVPQVLEDCVAAKALNVVIYSAGFGETGEAEAKELDGKIREIASRGGPRIFLKHSPDFGFGTSKVISYGNGLMLDALDFVEYLADDPETSIICVYLEGIRDGRRFAELVRRTNRVKPVIIWKGGLTEPGGRAAASHTASLTGAKQIWEAFFKQTGAVRVGSIEEMADVVMTMLRLKPSPSRRVAVLSVGGGSNVATGDMCAEEGLEVTALSPRTMATLGGLLSSVNQGVTNPMDAPSVFAQMPLLKNVLQVLAADPMIDTIILNMNPDMLIGLLALARADFERTLLESYQEKSGGLNVVVAVSEEYRGSDIEKYALELRQSGIAAYGSLRRACRALRRFAAYHEFVSQMAAKPKAD